MLRTLFSLSRRWPLCLAVLAAVLLPDVSQAGLFDCFGCGTTQTTYYAPTGCCQPAAQVTYYRPGLLQRLFGGSLFPVTAYYAGTANACCVPQTCCTPCQQTVQYVPQVAYRPQTVCTPVTTYQSVTACDPCTGCPTTVLRPVTSMVQQVRYVPYMTLRPVVSQCCPTTCCDPCPTNCCGTTTTVVGGAAVINGGAAAPGTSGDSIPRTFSDQEERQRPADTGSAPKTFRNDDQNGNPHPAGDSGSGARSSGTGSRSALELNDPRNRSTALPDQSWTFRRAVAKNHEIRPALLPASQPPTAPASDDGWEAVR